MNKMKAKEPTASYIHSTTNVPFDKTYERFGERYRKAKAFAYAHFDKEYAQSLEARNFLLDAPFPAERCETEADLERIIRESEASGVCTQEEVDKMFARWKSFFLKMRKAQSLNLKAPCLLYLCVQIL